MQLPVAFYGEDQMAPHDAVCDTLTDCAVDGPAWDLEEKKKNYFTSLD